MDLAEFLLARIANDESKVGWIHDEGCDTYSTAAPGGLPCDCSWPKRMAAECEAKRRIISRCDMVLRGRAVGMFNDGQGTDAADNLRALALPYADHPYYQQEWTP
jgi:hypothetical protein